MEYVQPVGYFLFGDKSNYETVEFVSRLMSCAHAFVSVGLSVSMRRTVRRMYGEHVEEAEACM